jgi:hypothetical protein
MARNSRGSRSTPEWAVTPGEFLSVYTKQDIFPNPFMLPKELAHLYDARGMSIFLNGGLRRSLFSGESHQLMATLINSDDESPLRIVRGVIEINIHYARREEGIVPAVDWRDFRAFWGNGAHWTKTAYLPNSSDRIPLPDIDGERFACNITVPLRGSCRVKGCRIDFDNRELVFPGTLPAGSEVELIKGRASDSDYFMARPTPTFRPPTSGSYAVPSDARILVTAIGGGGGGSGGRAGSSGRVEITEYYGAGGDGRGGADEGYSVGTGGSERIQRAPEPEPKPKFEPLPELGQRRIR